MYPPLSYRSPTSLEKGAQSAVRHPPWLWKVCGRLEAEDSEAPPLHEFIEEVNAKALEAQREVSSFEGATEGEMALRWRQGGY